MDAETRRMSPYDRLQRQRLDWIRAELTAPLEERRLKKQYEDNIAYERALGRAYVRMQAARLRRELGLSTNY